MPFQQRTTDVPHRFHAVRDARTEHSSADRAAADRHAAGQPLRALEPAGMSFATLFQDERLDAVSEAVLELLRDIGAPFDGKSIPVALARGGTVGRIGVPRDAVVLMGMQRVLVGASIGSDPLAPVSRLWRGLQRRADVVVDIRQCTTLPGSDADLAGHQRDVLLFSQRLVDGTSRRRSSGAEHEAAGQWARARQAAEMAYSLAVTENRKLLLVLPVGRGTAAQQLFTDALERQARQQRLPSPRTVKAGLLSALLTGDGGRERWLVASVMSIDEMRATADEAVGDTGPWPVLSFGRTAAFYDMPAQQPGAPVDPLPFLLVVSSLLQRSGRADVARLLMNAALMTWAAVTRVREEFGTPMPVPVDAWISAVKANWGRAPLAPAPRERRASARSDTPVVAGLRLRIETSLSSTAVREAVNTAVMPAGLEVASVRASEGSIVVGRSSFDVRIRSQLGEPPLSDSAAGALVRALGSPLRCVAVEPWNPGASERPRARAVA